VDVDGAEPAIHREQTVMNTNNTTNTTNTTNTGDTAETEPSRVHHLTDLALMAGDLTTEDEARQLRDILVARGLLTWASDAEGGWLTATEPEFAAALNEVEFTDD
jgi:hypothetical protein